MQFQGGSASSGGSSVMPWCLLHYVAVLAGGGKLGEERRFWEGREDGCSRYFPALRYYR